MSHGSKNVVQSALKVLDTLRLLVAAESPLLVTELAKTLEVSTTTAYRAAETLVVSGFARRALTGGYSASFEILALADGVVGQTGIRDVARGILVDVARKYGETITLAVRDGDQIIFIDRVEGSRDLSTFCEVGRKLPLHAGAAGRCVLAYLPEEDFERYVATGPRDVLKPSAVVSEEALRADRQDIRRRGYSMSFNQVDSGVSAVGVPILDSGGGILAAMAIASRSGGWSRNDIAARGASMRDAATRIQNRHSTLIPRRQVG